MNAARAAAAALAVAAGSIALAAVPSPLPAEDDRLDYQAVRAAMPQMKELAEQGHALVVAVHALVDKLESSADPKEKDALREQIRKSLVEYRAVKSRTISTVRPLVKIPQSKLTDAEVLEKLRGTDLHGISWDGAFFDKCIRDLSEAIGIPIRLQFRVVQKNQVSMLFQKAPAEMILATLCNGFQLRYVIHEGEIVIYKRITPTEDRFLEYQKRHPDVKLRYWESEDASGDVKKGGK
ncbi:MAG: hypothetical protein HMLKMBBP_01202 [Planctomycetes bacterium]|nr:hypothetical protein [Planctomycetota bacterium]